MKSKIAIVILNWNGASMLEQFLPILMTNTTMPGAEIVVADNNSTDHSMQLMHTTFPTIRTIQLEKNYGFAGGYNRALREVEAEYYLLLNSDIEVTQNWLEPLVEYLDLHPNVAAAQPKLLDYNHRDRFEYAGGCGGYMDRWGYLYCRGRVFDTVERDSGQYDTTQSVFWATGAALAIRSKEYWSVGGLDDDFFAHQEEVDLCWRLHARGRDVVCIPSSVVYHIGGATLNSSSPYKTYLNFRNNLLMLYKNLPSNELSRVMVVRTLLDAVAAMVYLFKGDVANMRAILRARHHYRKLKPKFLSKRRENLEKQSVARILEQKQISILWQYHIRRRREFSKIF